jgi:hypothetical protein
MPLSPHWRTPRFLAAMGVLLVSIVAASRPFWPGELVRHPWMTFLRDDFFYYLLIARHFAQGQGSTFNTLVRTNGYHPLWMLLLAALCRISIAPAAVLAFVAVTATLSTMVSYWLALRLLERCGFSGWLAALGAAYAALCVLPLCFYGMEVTAAMPAALALALHGVSWSPQQGPRWWLTAGLLTSLLTLARVDALLLGLLLALLLACAALSRSGDWAAFDWRQGIALAAGCGPALLYLLLNRLYFGLWAPISGVAKQLRSGWKPAFEIWIGLVHGPRSTVVNLLLVAMALGWLAVAPLLRRSLRFSRVQRSALAALLAYPFLFMLLLSIRSDWGVWPWYTWVLQPAACAAVIVLLGTTRQGAGHALAIAALALLLLLRVHASVWYPGQMDVYQAAVDVERFSRSHPGIYAMGDHAGMVGWLLPYPLVQTEGLVMDRAFLEHIRRQDPLVPVLGSYGVRYYIVDDWAGGSLMEGNCFHAAEPGGGSNLSPRMRSVFCQPPLLQVTHQDVTTRIFQMRESQRATAAGDHP